MTLQQKITLIWVVLFFFRIAPTHAQKTASQGLVQVIAEVAAYESYNKEEYPLGRFTVDIAKKEADFAQQNLASLQKIAVAGLSETEQISHELLRFTLQNTVDEYRFEQHLNPLQADQGFHLNLNYRIKPILSYADAEKYIRELEAIPTYVDEHLALLRESLEKGISQPRVIFNGYESTYDIHLVDDATQSAFYAPFTNLPKQLSKAQTDAIKQAAVAVITNKVLPSFKKIKSFFETEYLPKTRTSLGVSETPNGKAFYQNRINYYTTTTEYTAEDIHQIGLSEVSRIRGEMEKIIKEVGFKRDFAQFLHFLRTDSQFYVSTGEELLKTARDIAKRIDATLPKFFKTLPRRPYGVVKVPDAIAPKYTAGRYSGGGSDTEPGYYLVNTYKLDSRTLYTLPALTAHEAVPGHHLQGSLNKELGDSIPQFRKNTYLSAYGEGWALYTEFLGNELGIYTTPYEEFGKYTYEMWRACRLVVDTGIHAKGWSRAQALNFMLENTALSKHEVNTETDRYIGWPGQAISYKIGELKIRELRKRAELALGSKFNIRDFHEVILEQGTVTLPILEQRINRYISNTK